MDEETINEYALDQEIELDAAFTDPNNVAADPTQVVCMILKPDGGLLTYTYGVDAELVRTGVGAYYVALVPDKHGMWAYMFKGTGGVKAAGWRQFFVPQSPFGDG